MDVTPITLTEANQFVAEHHRHHPPVVGHKFSIAVSDDAGVRGVVIVGRPAARAYDDGWTLEVTRCCTDGVRNGCSMLYGAARRAAFAMGYRRLITYTLADDESGSSLRGAGWREIARRKGRSWNTPSRPRVDTPPLQDKLLWEAPEA